MTTPPIRLDLIEVRPRLRDTDDDVVETYKESMAERGLFQPILIERKPSGEGPGYILVDGAHRLEAARRLGWNAIAAEVRAASSASERRLVEIDANLVRKDLSVLERSAHLSARKVVYEELYPDTRNGAQGGVGGQKNENGIIPFSLAAADKFGCSRSTVEKLVMIDQRLCETAREAIKNTEAGQKLTELLALARLEPELQEKVAARLADPDTAETTVGKARDAVEGRAAATEKADADAKMTALWMRAGAYERAAFLTFLSEQKLPAGWLVAREGELDG